MSLHKLAIFESPSGLEAISSRDWAGRCGRHGSCRVTILGKTQKTLDLDIMLPSTGERAFVQVKSKTTSAELEEYVRKLKDEGPYERMFYVYHSGEAETDDERVSVIGPKKLAELVVDAGLVNWLIRKVS
jgi:hypothetical protein